MEVAPRLPAEPGRPRGHLRASRDRRAGAAERRSRSYDAAHDAAGGQPPGPVPVGDAVVQPGARASRWATPSTRSRPPSASSACRPRFTASFQGTAQAFQASLANQPLLILAALVTVYIVLGMLYESYIHPITILSTLPSAGVGALLALLLCRHELNVIALIGIILLIGIVKKNAIMMIDFAHRAERSEGKPPRGRDLRGLPAALPADHDDDDGGAARRAAAGARHRHRLGAAPAARHHHRRRPDRLASC